MPSNKCSWLCFSPEAVLPNTSLHSEWSRHHLKSKDVVFRETKNKVLSWESKEGKIVLGYRAIIPSFLGNVSKSFFCSLPVTISILDLEWCWFFYSFYNYKGISNIKPLTKLYSWSFKFAGTKYTLKFFSLYCPLSIWTKLLTHWPNAFEALSGFLWQPAISSI